MANFFSFFLDEYTIIICSSCIDPFTVTSDGKIQFYDIYVVRYDHSVAKADYSMMKICELT
jgi:hypothetical protein